MKDSTNYICPSCEGKHVSIFYELNSFPVHTVLNIASKEEAIGYQRGDIHLSFCHDCGFISNVAFKQNLLAYGADCEESQGFSPTFKAFSSQLALRLVDQYNLQWKKILEIGCGKGEFLAMLCNYGRNHGVGFDPAYVEGRALCTADGGSLEFIKDFYSEKYSAYKADFICCQMTLEHIPAVGDFVRSLRKAIGNSKSTVVFFQVPDVTRILRDCAFEDIYYEHCSYFSPESISKLFRANGFEILNVRTEYDGQYLTMEALSTNEQARIPFSEGEGLNDIGKYISSLSQRVQKKLSSWQKGIQEIKEGRTRGVVWGSGSKGVSFLVNLDLADVIKYVVDINPRRQGMFMPGTGQEIVGPDALKEIRPDVVFIMNRVYEGEIRDALKNMGLAPKIISL